MPRKKAAPPRKRKVKVDTSAIGNKPEDRSALHQMRDRPFAAVYDFLNHNVRDLNAFKGLPGQGKAAMARDVLDSAECRIERMRKENDDLRAEMRTIHDTYGRVIRTLTEQLKDSA